MAGPLTGLTGLYGPADPEVYGTTEREPSNWGGPPSSSHKVPGDSSGERRTKGSLYPQDTALLGQTPPVAAPSGHVRDETPQVHSAPTMAPEQDPVVAAEASVVLHGLDFGGSKVTKHAPVHYPVTVQTGITLSPEQSLLVPVPDQLRSGSTDLDQGFGQPNSGTFAHGHQFRRVFKDPIPQDTSLLLPEDRPFYGKHPVRQNLLNGDDSPYAQAGDFTVGMNFGPTPTTDPTPYEQPPNPDVAASAGFPGEAPVIDYGWVAG